MNRLPELLCPAGSPAALAAAVQGGADAVYMGGVAFNARVGAKNFSPDEFRDGVALAHAHGVKAYMTLNTLIYDKERDDLLRAAEDAYLAGIDALIVADLGAARLIRDRIPVELHASTQLAGHNADAARRLADFGFTRMVCAREMSREDLIAFTERSPIEAEIFVHGALCVCHSGQCLFSSLVGGRSGNRGECAQPCRLPFRNGKGNPYPLSLKDLSLAAHLPELCDMGIASLKIEGRMKSPEYVRDVSIIFRRLLDEKRGADDREMADLAAIFSRGGLTDGYYEKKIGRSMMGIRSERDKESSRTLVPFEGLTKKIPLSLSVSVQRNTPSQLTMTAPDGKSVAVTGEIPQIALTAPLTKDTVAARFSKLGNTPYAAGSVEVLLDDGLMLPVSAMNDLRRRGVDRLSAPTPLRSPSDFSPKTDPKPLEKGIAGATAAFLQADRIPEEAHGFFDLIYVPLEQYTGQTKGVILPPVIFDSDREEIAAMLRRAKELGATDALVGNVGHLSLAAEAGLTLHGDFRLNVTNRVSAAYWEAEGLADIILSPELTLPQLRDVGGKSRAVVYGRIPLMVTEKCVGKELTDCRTCTEGGAVLTDRRGVRFPVLRAWKHRSVILNSVPVYMADRKQELARARLGAFHFIFTTESKKEISSLIQAYRRGLPPTGEVRRIK